MGCGCSGIQSVSGLGNAGPDGLGAFSALGRGPGGIFEPVVSGVPAFEGVGAWQPMWAAAGVGAGPDGLGAIGGPALLGSVTGNVALDAAAVGAIGYFVAPNDKDRKFWAAAGAAAGLLAGTLGLIGLIGFAVYQRRGT
jgi:hypothetical protein